MAALMTDRLPGPFRAAVLDRCRRAHHEPGDVLASEGATADALHLLVSGHVTVTVSTPQGDCATLAVLGPGSTFGEVALVSAPALRSATVRALGRCETLVLHRRDLAPLRRAHPGLDAVLMDLLAAQVCRLTELLTEALYLPAERRVLRRLLDLAEAFAAGGPADPDGIRIPVTQDVLATMAGTSRVTTNQVLQRLQHNGTVGLGRRRITVADLPSLRRAAQEGHRGQGVPAPLSPRRRRLCDGQDGPRLGARMDGDGVGTRTARRA